MGQLRTRRNREICADKCRIAESANQTPRQRIGADELLRSERAGWVRAAPRFGNELGRLWAWHSASGLCGRCRLAAERGVGAVACSLGIAPRTARAYRDNRDNRKAVAQVAVDNGTVQQRLQ